MARTKNNQRSASRVAVDVGATGTKPASKGAVAILAVSVLAAIWAVAMMTVPGRVGYVWFFMYAEFYMGVITLVSLSITIMIGLVSTDRLVLSIRQRVLLQSAHRTTGVIAIAALVFHVWTKFAREYIGVLDIFIPFLLEGNRLYVGFGTISAWVMVLVMWSGLARARFIGRGSPWMWRGIHAISYLMWPIALMHGLGAGRPAKAWVIVSYIVCVLGVLVGLAVRLSVSLNRRKDFASPAGVGAAQELGKLVPTSSPGASGGGRRPARQERVTADVPVPAANVSTFQPVAPLAPPAPAMEPVMEVPRQRFDEPTGQLANLDMGGRRLDDEIEYDEPAPRQRRYADDDTMTWSRREMRDVEQTGTRMRRPELEDSSARMRRSDLEDTGSRRRVDFEDTGSRRRADLEDTGSWSRRGGMEDTGSWSRRSDIEDTSTRMRRSDLDDSSARMRRSDLEDTSTRMRRSDLEDTGTRRRVEMDYEDPAPRGRRYADDEPPAPRSRRRAAEPLPMYEDAPRPRGEYEDVPRQRGRYADEEPPPRRSRRESRYDREGEDAPRDRRDRGADIDSADSGRHSRSGFVDLAEPAGDRGYLPPDDDPTLIDMESRRARRTQQDSGRGQAGRGARRGGAERGYDDAADEAYFSSLRGEAN